MNQMGIMTQIIEWYVDQESTDQNRLVLDPKLWETGPGRPGTGPEPNQFEKPRIEI